MHLSIATHVASAGFEGLAPQGPPTNVALVLALRITQLSHVYFEKIFQGGVFLI